MMGLAGATETHERDGKHSFSYQSLMPAGAGTRRYENWVPGMGTGLAGATVVGVAGRRRDPRMLS